MKEDKHLEELLNRKPNKWGNVSVKEFQRDILIMQNTILTLQDKLDEQNLKTQEYINKWVETLTMNLEMMNEYLPAWRLEAKDEIKQLKELLK